MFHDHYEKVSEASKRRIRYCDESDEEITHSFSYSSWKLLSRREGLRSDRVQPIAPAGVTNLNQWIFDIVPSVAAIVYSTDQTADWRYGPKDVSLNGVMLMW